MPNRRIELYSPSAKFYEGAANFYKRVFDMVDSEDKWKGPDGVLLDVTDQAWTGALPLGKV
jgi:hypothetical protein